jgi:predicted TIM-barrel fold metal-dependent hydrolase
MDYNVVSVDDHVSESPTTFTSRVPASMQDQVPTTKKDVDGITYYFLGDQKLKFANHYVADEEEAQIRRDKGGLLITYSYDPPGEWDHQQRLRDYELDGVDAGVLFHNFSGGDPVAVVQDLDVRLACLRAVNDWMIEEVCSTDPRRLFGLAVVPPWDVDLAKQEAIRAVQLGHRGICWLPIMDAAGYKPLWDTYWNDFYATVEELGVPLCLHVGITPNWGLGIRADRENAPEFVTTSLQLDGTHSLMYPLIEILMSGLLERFPRLKIFLAEGGASWVPYTLMQCDHYWPRYRSFDRSILRMPPSDYARRQVHYGFFVDQITPDVVATVGEDNIMWEGDYCHTVATFPNSRHYQKESLKTITDDRIRHKILAGNAVDLFKLND